MKGKSFAAVRAAALSMAVLVVACAPYRGLAEPQQAAASVPFETWKEAVREGDAGRVRRLIRQGANVNATDQAGYTALHRYRYTGYITGVQYRTLGNKHYAMVELLRKNGFDFTAIGNGEGMLDSNLTHSFWKDDYRLLEELHKAGAPVTGSAVVKAAFWEKVDALKWVLSKGGDANSGLAEAARNFRATPQLMTLLLEAGAKGPSDADALQSIRLELAENGGAAPLAILLQRNVPPRTCPPEGTSEDYDCKDAFELVMAGIEKGRPAVIEALAANGVSTASIDGWKDTALHEYLRDDADDRRRADSNGRPPPPLPSDAVQAALAAVIRSSPGIVRHQNRLGTTPPELAGRHATTKLWYEKVLSLASSTQPLE